MKEILKKTFCLLIDLDGVLTRNKDLDLFPDTISFLEELRELAIPFQIATNNSRNLPSRIQSLLESQGLQIRLSQITTPFTVLEFVLRNKEFQKIFVIGEKDLIQYATGLAGTEGGGEAVLIGFDRNFSGERITEALNRLKNGAELFCMNGTVLVKNDAGQFVPGPGAIAKMFQAAFHDRIPCTYLGKGTDDFDRHLFGAMDPFCETVAFLSDDPWTDLEVYSRRGMYSIFITTGKYGKGDLAAGDFVPDLTVDSLTELLGIIKTGVLP